MKRICPSLFSFVLLAKLVLISGCTPKIGDACVSSLDCSQASDRLCDASQPGGYCTLFSCEPDRCPDGDGICIAFDSSLDPKCGGADDGAWARFERTFCMAACSTDTDCRDGYECAVPADRGARIIDLDPLGTRICLTKISGSTSAVPASVPPPPICTPSGPVDTPPPYVPGGGGAGGAGGGGGAGGAGGGL